MPFRILPSLLLTAALSVSSATGAAAQEPSPEPGMAAPDQPAPAPRKSRRRHAAVAPTEPSETLGGLAGRYAVMRDKRDTGCMLTLDNTRVKGGARAQLAPGCRDQGIVIFDPSIWALAQGELVLTARAGHKTRLVKEGEGAWKKDPKDGGKPLGLKRL